MHSFCIFLHMHTYDLHYLENRNEPVHRFRKNDAYAGYDFPKVYTSSLNPSLFNLVPSEFEIMSLNNGIYNGKQQFF